MQCPKCQSVLIQSGINLACPACGFQEPAQLRVGGHFGGFMVLVIINIIILLIVGIGSKGKSREELPQALIYLQGGFLLFYAILIPFVLRSKIILDSATLTMLDQIQHKAIGKKVVIKLSDVVSVGVGSLSYIEEELHGAAGGYSNENTALNAATGVAAQTNLTSAIGAVAGMAAAERVSVFWLVAITNDGTTYGMKLGTLNPKEIKSLVSRLRALLNNVHAHVELLGIKIAD